MSIMIPPVSTAGGRDMSMYIRELREYLRDLPQYGTEQFNGTGATTEFLCTKLPINDDQFVQVLVGGLPQQIVTDMSLITPGRVYLDYDTGYMIFGTSPPSGIANVIVRKRRVQWRDSTLARALMAGVRATWPSLWQLYTDTSIQIQTNVWDYTLPDQFFQSTGVYITKVELQNVPQGQPQPFLQEVVWEKIGNATIKLLNSQFDTVGATLRISFAGPYTDITQMEGRAANLPILYAAAMLLGTQEIARSRSNLQTTAADQSGNAAGASSNAGSYFQKMFYQELSQLARPIPMATVRSTYAR